MKILTWLSMLVCSLVALISGVAFLQGSLELFPTPEQQASARLSYGVVLLIAAVSTILLGLRLRALYRTL